MAEPIRVPAPKIDRSVTLHFRGDWGRANLHRALGWLGYELLTLAGPRTRFAIWNGRGGYDNVAAVGHGEVDLALATPASFVPMVIAGKGPCGRETFPHIRALGHVPQHDRLVVALRRDLGIRSFAELREKRPSLRITLGPDDSVSFMGVGAQLLLAAHGLPRSELERWGCSFIEYEEPHLCISAMRDAKADMIVQEAVMTAYWRDLAEKQDLVFLPIEPAARDALATNYDLATARLPKDYLRGIDREMEFLDFSHFILLTTTDLPEDIAYALAWTSIERFGSLEAQYRHLPPERSPVSYPIDPKLACRSPIPLHPGAARYFREAGHL